MLLVTTAALLAHLSTAMTSLPPYRLPGNVVPHHYNLKLITDLDKFIFSGHVNIDIECKTATNTIKVHAVSLKITEDVTLKQKNDDKVVGVSGIKFDTENEFLIISLEKPLVAGSRYFLNIAFDGELTDGLSGYYRSSYVDSATNLTKWLAVTQFEATDARRAFPCFDEPAMKAKFTIHLGHKEHLTSISNMPLAKNSTEDGWVWDEYQETVKMSTYLVAFMVSDFDFRQSDPEPNNVVFRVWARKDAIDQVDFSRQYGPKFLNYFEDFFGVSYPLPKQDMVAIPDFAAGAMENWGLITYRESQVLLDNATTSVSFISTIADTVAHELAHQWFGNLVTMKWWTDLWLNEGFATYVASLAVRHQFPEWNSYNLDVTENLLDVFLLDSLKTSHPVSVPIGHPNEINEIFDTISYKKGGLLLHMMNSFLGDDVFKSGVSSYIKKFAYGNSEQDDLWKSLTEAAEEKGVLPKGVTVEQVMGSWTLETGYPVLTVQRNGGTLTLSQKRFLAIRSKENEVVKGCWWVPVTYSTAKSHNVDTRSQHWLQCDQSEMVLNTGAGPDDWIILNNKASGIYRVNYDAHTWKLLANALQSKDVELINELNRVQLVADAMALAYVGDLKYPMAFQLLSYIEKEAAYLPWVAATSALSDIRLILWRTDKYSQFSKFVKTLLSEVYKRFSDLEAEPTGVEEIKHKSLIVKWACLFKVADCSSKAVKLFQSWMTSKTNPIPKDLRNTVYCEGVRQGGEAEWQYVWQKYQTSNIANEKYSFLSALGCTQQENLLNRFLEWSITPSSGIRRQDTESVFFYVAINSQLGYKLAWNFLEKNIKRLHQFLSPNTQELGHFIKVLASRIVFTEEKEKMNNFVTVNNKLLEKSQLTIKQSMETAESNLQWMNNFYGHIDQALSPT